MAKDLKRAEFVKEMREERAWPQRQLADVSGINLRTVQRLEKDGTAAFATLMAIAAAFEIDVKQLRPASGKQKKDQAKSNVHLLPRLTSGKSIADIIGGAELFQISNDIADDERAVSAMKSILELFKGDIVRWYAAEPAKRLEIEFELSQELKGLESYGFYLFGIKREIPKIVDNKKIPTTMCTIYMSHSGSPKIIRDKNSNMVLPAVLSEVAR